MLKYETAKRLAALESELERARARTSRSIDAEARGALSWGGKAGEMARLVYLERIVPLLTQMANNGDEDGLCAALDAEEGKASAPTSGLVGDRLREERESRGITQAELAEKIGTTQSQIAKYERNEQDMTVLRFLEIANAMGADPSKLIK